MCLHLAQAFSNRAPRGRKHDFKDAERLVRRLIAKELILSFVPNGEQRIRRNLTRMKLRLVRDRVRLQSQIECLLEEMRIKLSVPLEGCATLFGSVLKVPGNSRQSSDHGMGLLWQRPKRTEASDLDAPSAPHPDDALSEGSATARLRLYRRKGCHLEAQQTERSRHNGSAQLANH
jgi:hypothetical protein